MLDKSRGQRDDLLENLQSRIDREKSLVYWRLAHGKSGQAKPPLVSRARRTGRLYNVFQAHSYDKDNG